MDWNLFWMAAGVIASLGGIFIGGFFSIVKQISNIGTRLAGLEKQMGSLEIKVDNMDHRLSKLEGSFEERGRWESRKIT